MKPESQETQADEDAETPAQQEKEMKEGTEQHPDGVVVSEEFQQKAHQLLHKASKHEVKHVHDRAYAREDELRKEEESKKPSKGQVPNEYSAADMPE